MAFKVTGRGEIEGNLRRIRQQFPAVTARALVEELTEVELPETQALVPIDTGDLLSTGRVTEPVIQRNTVTAGIAYGGEAPSGEFVDYAVYVHENLDAIHPVGQAKFVSQPMNEAAPHMAARLAERMRFDRWVR